MKEQLKIRIKKLHPDAKIPAYAKLGDAGMDLTAVSFKCDDYGNLCYGTGLAIEIPEGYVGLLFPRSSNSKYDIVLTNHVGVIDSGYRGEISMKFATYRGAFNYAPGFVQMTPNRYNIGDRIGQLIVLPYPKLDFIEVDELSETERGNEGYGSTGN